MYTENCSVLKNKKEKEGWYHDAVRIGAKNGDNF